MKHVTRLVAVAIVAAELVSLGLAATSASAQDSQQVRRQQRLILQQQRQIEQNQRRLEAQQHRLAERPRSSAESSDASSSAGGGFSFCPPHYYINLAYGCLPDLNYLR